MALIFTPDLKKINGVFPVIPGHTIYYAKKCNNFFSKICFKFKFDSFLSH